MLVTTPKSSTANSYATVQEADAYLDASRLYATEWAGATQATKEAALIWATTLLDRCFEWRGIVTDRNQALRWPRSLVYDEEGRYFNANLIPNRIREAASELAYFLVKRDRLAEPDVLGQGLREAVVGPIRVAVDPAQVLPLIPRHLVVLLDQMGEPKDRAIGGSTVVKLVRS